MSVVGRTRHWTPALVYRDPDTRTGFFWFRSEPATGVGRIVFTWSHHRDDPSLYFDAQAAMRAGITATGGDEFRVGRLVRGVLIWVGWLGYIAGDLVRGSHPQDVSTVGAALGLSTGVPEVPTW